MCPLQKAKLSKSVVAKAYLLTIYNKEYERLKQAHIQLQQQVSQKNKVNTDTGTSAERQPGDGVETPDDTLRPEVKFFYWPYSWKYFIDLILSNATF